MYQVACSSLTWSLYDLNNKACNQPLKADFLEIGGLGAGLPNNITKNNKIREHTIITECLNLQTFLEQIPFSHNSQVISFPNAAGWCL